MGFQITGWNDIGRNMEGSFMHRIAETGKAMTGLVTSPVGIVWDLSRMVTGEDGAWTDLKNSFGAGASALAAPFTLALDPLTPVFEGLYVPYKYGVSPTLSSAGIVGQKLNPFTNGMLADSGEGTELSDTNWGDIWSKAHEVSPGNAVLPAMHLPGAEFVTWNPLGLYTNDWAALFDGDWEKFAQSVGKSFRPWTKEDLEAIDKNNGGFSWNIATGLADAAATWFLDPLVIGGKITKGYRAVKWASDVPHMLENKKVLDRLGLAGETRDATRIRLNADRGELLNLPSADRMINWSNDQIIESPLQAEMKFYSLFGGKKNPNSRVLASLLRESGERDGSDGIRNMLKVIIGDSNQTDFMRTERAGLWHSLGQAENQANLLREVLNTNIPGASNVVRQANLATVSAHAPQAITAGVIDSNALRSVVDHLNTNVIPDYRAHDDYLEKLVGDINRPDPVTIGEDNAGMFAASTRNLPFTTGGVESLTRLNKHIGNAERAMRREYWDPRVNFIDRAVGVNQMKAPAIKSTTASTFLQDVQTQTYYPSGILGLPVRAYRIARRSLTDPMPVGWADLNDSSRAAEETYRMLTRVKGLNTETIHHYTSLVAKSNGEEQIKAAVMEAENTAIRHIASRYGIHDDMADQWARAAQERKSSAHKEFSRGSEAEFGILTGEQRAIVHRISDEDGIPESMPFTLKQLENKVPLLDMDIVQKDFARRHSVIRRLAGYPFDTMSALGDIASATWKFSVLIRGIGYPIKVLADDGARYWAVLDSLAEQSAPRTLSQKLMAGFSSGSSKGAHRLPTGMRDWWRGQPVHARDIGGRARALVRDEPYRRQVRPRSGEGSFEAGGVEFPELFAGRDSDLLRSMFSGDWQAMRYRERNVLNDIRMKSGGRRVRATVNEGEHLSAWADNINYQLASDPIGSRMLQGWTDAQLTHWFSAQKGLRKRNEMLGRNPEATVQRIRALMDQYFPENLRTMPDTEFGTLANRAIAKQTRPEDLSHIMMAGRPDVHDIDFSLNLIHGDLGQMLSGVLSKTYSAVVGMPHTAMVRHPLANQLYQSRVKELSELIVAQKGHINVQDFNRIQHQSRRFALHQVGQIVMDTASESSAAHALRFIMPFFDPWRESLTRWSKLFYEDPTRLYRIAQYRNSWGSAFELQDQDGNKLDIRDPKVPVEDQKFVLRLPEKLAKRIPGLEAMSQLDIPRGATDFVFQGQRWYEPDFGPFVKIPASRLLENKPDLEDQLKWMGVMPDGAVDWKTLVVGSSWRNFYKMVSSPEGDRAYMQSMLYIALNEHQKYLDGTRKTDVNWDEVKDNTKTLWATKFFAGLMAPVSTQFKPKTQWMIDEYRRLIADPAVGIEKADEVFYDKYPEAFMWAATMSKNNAHLPASELAMKRTRKYKGLISQHPDMAAVIVGNVPGKAEFSPSVYQWQMNNLLGSGTGKNYRAFQSARDAYSGVQEREGWVKWQKFSDGITATLNSRGLVDLDDSGAEDLLQMKQQFVQTLAGENPAWSEAWFTSNDRQVPDWIEAARDIVADPRLMKDQTRQDLSGLTSYISVRDEFLTELRNRKAEGGSGDITAEANSDLYAKWKALVGQLKESNTEFSTLYQRYLESDKLQEGTFTVTPEGLTSNTVLEGIAA